MIHPCFLQQQIISFINICGALNQIIIFILTFEKIFSQVLFMIQNGANHFGVEWNFFLFIRFATQVNYKVKFVV